MRAKLDPVDESEAAELRDGDVLLHISSEGASRPGWHVSTVPWEDALAASYRALGAPSATRFSTVSVADERACTRTAIALRRTHGNACGGPLRGASDELCAAFLARGMLSILQWLDCAPDPRLADLLRALRTLASGTLPTDLADRVSPDPAELVSAVAAWEQARRSVGDTGSVRVITNRGSHDVDLTQPFPDPDSLRAEITLAGPVAEMIFVVEQPDYTASGRWLLRHGDRRFAAASGSPAVFDAFHRRELDVRPGDALHCRVRMERLYDISLELLCERVEIVELVKVFPNVPKTGPRKASPPVHREPWRQEEPAAETSPIVETIEGDFGTLTLRRIPID